MTNIIAIIVVCITTNVYQPTQYFDNSYNCCVLGCTQDHSSWIDAPMVGGQMLLWGGQKTRPNPDVRITEIREVKSARFSVDGKEYAVEISNTLLSSKRERRKVQTTEEWTAEP